MFKKNSIGEKINTILINNNVKFENDISFEEAVKNSSDYLEKILNEPCHLGKKSVLTSLHTNERVEIDFWKSAMLYFFRNFFIMMHRIPADDVKVISYIFDAVRYENEKDYHEFFEDMHETLKFSEFKVKTQGYKDIVYRCLRNLYFVPSELRLTKYKDIFEQTPENVNSNEPNINIPYNFTKNDWINLENMLNEDVKPYIK